MENISIQILLFSIVLVCIFDLAPAPRLDLATSRPVPVPNWKLNSSVTQRINAKCKKIEGQCKRQPNATVNARKSLKKKLIKQARRKDSDVEEAFKRTYLAKKALYKLQGLENIEPADNGIWAQHMILNAEQAKYIENFYNSGGKAKASTPPPPPKKGGGGKNGNGKNKGKRSVGFRFDAFPIKKWDGPIPVFIDPNFSTDSASEIRRALSTIESKSCIKFNEISTPTDGDYMLIVSFDISGGIGCGASYVGKQTGVTLVSIRPVCSPTYGIALHEIMHALGFHHEHQRYDRDQYITMLYTEQDPFYMDNLALLPPDSYTDYGTPYDYLSIMHYSLGFGWFKLVPGKGGEEVASQIGSLQGFSNTDIDGLNRAYCSNPNCKDFYDGCPSWDVTYDFCHWDPASYPMEKYCPKTCGLCK